MQKVVVNKVDSDGLAVGKIGDRTIIIGKALPGEVVEVKDIDKKNKYDIAKNFILLERSNDRVDFLCPYYEQCGGCVLQHANYQFQKNFKINKVKNSLKYITKKEVEINEFVESPNVYGYRNKIVFVVKGYECGMYEESTKKFVKIKNCMLASNNLNDLYKIIADWIKQYKIDINHIVLRELSGKYSIVLVGMNKPNIDNLIKMLDVRFQALYQIVFNYNLANKDLITDKLEYLYGCKIFDKNFGITYPVSPNTFLQVNKTVSDKLYQDVCSFVENKVVINSYSGAGLLTAIMSKKAIKVYGVEVVANATADANTLKENNHIKNMININGKAEIVVPKIIKPLKDIVLVFDPPRKGVDKKLIEVVNNSKNIDNIVYISCDPNSLAKDLRLLDSFIIKSIKLYDMFPQTKHVETVVFLEKI